MISVQRQFEEPPSWATFSQLPTNLATRLNLRDRVEVLGGFANTTRDNWIFVKHFSISTCGTKQKNKIPGTAFAIT